MQGNEGSPVVCFTMDLKLPTAQFIHDVMRTESQNNYSIQNYEKFSKRVHEMTFEFIS